MACVEQLPVCSVRGVCLARAHSACRGANACGGRWPEPLRARAEFDLVAPHTSRLSTQGTGQQPVEGGRDRGTATKFHRTTLDIVEDMRKDVGLPVSARNQKIGSSSFDHLAITA